MNDLESFIQQIRTMPDKTEFDDVISIIDKHYDYIPMQFSNGAGNEKIINAAGENEGSCKIFSFAKIHLLDDVRTLQCFGHYYRDDVLKHPENSDHGNIRTFIKYGWQHIIFEGEALSAKKIA